jgi:hypothetical protein
MDDKLVMLNDDGGELVGLFWFCASKKQPVPESPFDPTKKKLWVAPANSAGLLQSQNTLADPPGRCFESA